MTDITYPAPPQWLRAIEAGHYSPAEKPETVELGDRFLVRDLRRVNARINRTMPWVREKVDIWGEGSDCEDIALAKIAELVDLGWPAGALRLTLLLTEKGEAHCVVSVMDGSDDPWILDNRLSLVSRQSLREAGGDRFVAREMPGNLEFWERIGPPSVINLADVVEKVRPKPKRNWRDFLPWLRKA